VSIGWVAAAVRLRGMVQGRAGIGACRAAAASNSVAAACVALSASAYGERLDGVTVLQTAQRAVADTVLWQLRVLAGWLPPAGTRIAVVMTALFERQNILARYRELTTAQPAGEPFALGTLATAWPAVAAATTPHALLDALRRSPWGDLGEPADARGLADTLTLSLARRWAVSVPITRGWCEGAAALVTARRLLVDEETPDATFLRLCRPLIGDGWMGARSTPELARSTPPAARRILAAATGPDELWLAEIALARIIGDEGARALRRREPGAEVVAGGLAVVLIDAWRVRAALAAAEAARPEVFDVVA
jgi:hypothetical protein